MTGPATIRVRRPSGVLATFEAERVTVEHGLVTAVGRWRDDRHRRRRRYTWRAQVVEIQWRHELRVIA